MDYASIEATPKKVTYTMGDLVSFFQTHNFQQNDQLSAFLDGLTAQIQEDHNEHLALYTEQHDAALEEFAFREQEIKDAEDALARSQAQLQLPPLKKTEPRTSETSLIKPTSSTDNNLLTSETPELPEEPTTKEESLNSKRPLKPSVKPKTSSTNSKLLLKASSPLL
jgi:hypothetical protein